MTIAAMSRYAVTVGVTASSSTLFTALMRDASDRVMNGMMASEGGELLEVTDGPSSGPDRPPAGGHGVV